MIIKAEPSRHGEFTVVFRCPGCGRAIWISPKVNGQRVRCPFCGHTV